MPVASSTRSTSNIRATRRLRGTRKRRTRGLLRAPRCSTAREVHPPRWTARLRVQLLSSTQAMRVCPSRHLRDPLLTSEPLVDCEAHASVGRGGCFEPRVARLRERSIRPGGQHGLRFCLGGPRDDCGGQHKIQPSNVHGLASFASRRVPVSELSPR